MALPREVFEKIVFYKKEVDRIWGEYFSRQSQQTLSMVDASVDIYETDDAVIIDMEMPGVDGDSVEVSVATDVVMIVGERKKPRLTELNAARFHQAERAYGRFERLIEVPRPANMGRLEAALDNGVLRIRIPKVEDRRGQWRRVPVTETQVGLHGGA